eukprot:TRINITY_DN4630_c0_g1_i6.p1 TRINITY_DN4630_c0_g1~~TRINITY_DN4630_c0_g1_i6.p1  ORF type:complete len:101 (+),score=9.91 TRINITY_DN4630_c0_g1_i6:1-303(+)
MIISKGNSVDGLQMSCKPSRIESLPGQLTLILGPKPGSTDSAAFGLHSKNASPGTWLSKSPRCRAPPRTVWCSAPPKPTSVEPVCVFSFNIKTSDLMSPC